MCMHTSVCSLQHCMTPPPQAALQGWCQRVSPSQVSLGTHSHYRHFPSLSFCFSHAHTLTSLHACTQCSPHHKLMSHYSVISVLFAPPCLSAICHTAGTRMKNQTVDFHVLVPAPVLRAHTGAGLLFCFVFFLHARVVLSVCE